MAIGSAAVLVVALAISTRNGTPAATASPPATASPTGAPATAIPSPSAAMRPSIGSGIGADWTTVATFPGATVYDATAGGPGYVAVGASGAVGCEVCPGMSTYTGRIWTSTDGRTWAEAAVPGMEGSIVNHVAAGPNSLVAVRHHDSDPSDGQDIVTTQILVSPDGLTWTLVEGTPFESGGASISDLAGGVGFAAVGSLATGSAAIWQSPGGREWGPRLSDAYYEGAVLNVVAVDAGWTAVGDLYVTATGSSRDYIPSASSWGSILNQEWLGQPMPLPETAGGASAHAVLVTSAGNTIAVGYGEYPPTEPPGPVLGFAAWRNLLDVGIWEAAPVTDDFLEDIGGGLLVYEAPDRIFAIGSACRCGAGLTGRWWTTTDGLAWVEHAEAPPKLLSVIPFGGGLLAAGIENGAGAIFVSE